MVRPQPVDDVPPAPRTVQPRGAAGEIGLDLLPQMQPVAPQLGSGLAQRVLVVQPEIEVVFAEGDMLGRRLEPPLEIVLERRQRRRCLLDGGLELPRLLGCPRRERGRDGANEQQAPFVDPQRRLDEHPHRLDQRGARVVQERRYVLEPAHEGARLLLGRTVAAAQQHVQPGEEMLQPERRILRLRPLLLEPPQRDARFVQQRGAVDLVFEPVRGGFFQGGREGLERGDQRAQRLRAVPPVAVVVPPHARLRGRDGVELPAQVEVRAFDGAERAYRHAICLRRRWHSSSDRTRSVRFAASNSTRHAASCSASYPCVSSQYFTFDNPETGEISIFCASPSSSAGTELYTRDRKSTRLNSSH